MSKIICIIPARKGSKRLKGKNIKMFAGKPLIAWSIEVALQCKFINEIIITTDDPRILLDLAYKYIEIEKVKFLRRPNKLAQDDSTMEDVIFHVLEDKEYPFDTLIILLQPTSPLRTKEDIENALDRVQGLGCAVVSVFREDDLHFKLNGAIYIFTSGYLRRYKKITGREFLSIYIMPKERSIDIDTVTDFEVAEGIMKKRLEGKQ